MAEWSIAAVLKTVEVKVSGGSNPSLSANKAENQQVARIAPDFTPKNVELGVWLRIITHFPYNLHSFYADGANSLQ